jgi:RNA polymerase sigma-70 factor, ECF subfamily
MTDEYTLIARAARFDQAALGEIYDAYSPGVFRYAVRLLGDASLAEDCVADTFTRYLQALRAGGGPRDHLKAYLYRIAHNWITDRYRRQPLPPLALAEELAARGPDVLQEVIDELEQRQVRMALVTLTPDQRQVIVLKYLQGWKNEAVALAIHKPIGAVKALQHRALEALRRALAPGGPREEEMYESQE